MELKEVKKHIGERVYVESKKAYNQHKGEYILEGIMQVCELDNSHKQVWSAKLKLREINANCSIWIDFKGAVIRFLEDNTYKQNPPTVYDGPPSFRQEGEDLRTIEAIQKESLEKLKTLCQ